MLRCNRYAVLVDPLPIGMRKARGLAGLQVRGPILKYVAYLRHQTA